MAGDWYYVKDGGFEGPETASRLLELLDLGRIDRQTPLWRQGAPDWEPLQRALGFTERTPPPIPESFRGLSPQPAIRETVFKDQQTSGVTQTSGRQIRVHPWRRYFARLLDTIIGGSVVWLIIGFLLAVSDQEAAQKLTAFMNTPESVLVDAVGTIFFAMAPNALLIGFTRSSIGKLIFGVSVANPDGSRIGFAKALQREILVWVRGWGLGIPIVYLFTLNSSYKRLKKTQTTSWDDTLSTTVNYRPATTFQMMLNVVGVVILLACYIIIRAVDAG